MLQTHSRSAVEATLYVVVAGVGFVAAVPLFGVENWPLELVASFRCHILVGLVLVAALALARRHRVVAASLAIAALINAGDVVATAIGSAQMKAAEAPAAIGTDVRLLFANVAQGNDDHHALIAEIKRLDPEVVVLAEATQAWVDALDGLSSSYPYRIDQPRQHAFGMVLMSRLPLVEAGTEIILMPRPPDWQSDPPVALVAEVESAAGPVTLVGLHPFPPLFGSSYALRNYQLDMMADIIAQQEPPLVVVGDFNATPWSPTLRRFMKQTGLQGPNVLATWPTGLGLAGLPIDHVLLSRDLDFRLVERGGDIGSDHRPLFAVVTVADPE